MNIHICYCHKSLNYFVPKNLDLILKSQFNLQSEFLLPPPSNKQIKSSKAPSQEIKFNHQHVSLVQSFIIIKLNKPKLILARPNKSPGLKLNTIYKLLFILNMISCTLN